MIIILTNTSPAFKGLPVLLNTDFIVSVHRGFVSRDDEQKTVEEVTYVFCPPHGNWEVQESVEDIIAQIRGNTKTK